MAYTPLQPQISNRARSITTDTGTGGSGMAISDVIGYKPVDASDIPSLVPLWYVISHRTADEWECGYGYHDGFGAFWRMVARDGTSGTTKVSFSAGTKDVFIDVPASVLRNINHPTHNLIINGGFDRFERQVAGTATARADDTYGPDRFYVLTQTASVNCERSSVASVGTYANWSRYAVKLTQNQVTAQRFGLAQIIESNDTIPIREKEGIFHGKAMLSNGQALRYAILEWSGTADAVTSDVVNSWTNATFTAGNFFNSTTLAVLATGSITPTANEWTDFQITATPTSAANNLICFVWTEGTAAQNFTMQLTQLAMHHGGERRDWIARPAAVEEALCRRFCQVLVGPQFHSFVQSPVIPAYVPLPAPMRSTPVLSHNVTGYNAGAPGSTQVANFNVAVGYTTITGALTVTSDYYREGECRIVLTAGTSFSGTTGAASIIYFGSDVRLILDAEL